jgi:hypothetical protein
MIAPINLFAFKGNFAKTYISNTRNQIKKYFGWRR